MERAQRRLIVEWAGTGSDQMRVIAVHLSLGRNAARVAAASIKGQWQFQRARLGFLPRIVILDTLYKVPKLEDKWLVVSIHICRVSYVPARQM
jgi:hypothetical protein